ncbi:hypothetical protein MG293_003878 [Ovis ammon polii]|uniref:Uncharacterized protein n=1 Tax=Ovis ammon polii TaxID=230172 RepID=A0AAD4UHH9_OVIAM|nr:hypothetical protein MG293_003878 [Ovis ammon polii]KAI4577475.1 hypothetical protein MJT46_003310 [Ovis ammon polii x Ovis aries]
MNCSEKPTVQPQMSSDHSAWAFIGVLSAMGFGHGNANKMRKSLPRRPLQCSAQQALPWNEVVFRVLHTVTQEKNEGSFTVSLALFSSSEKAMPVHRASTEPLVHLRETFYARRVYLSAVSATTHPHGQV